MEEITIVLGLIVGVVSLSLTGLAVLLLKNRDLTNSVNFCLNEIALLEEQLEETQDSMAEFKEQFDSTTTKRGKARPRLKTVRSSLVSNEGTKVLRSSLSEQRTRVIKLAKNGSDSNTIAASLGMSPGEVELILRMNTVAANAA